ncbi:MAG: hypothetical protein LQ349_004910 [Xanthoria aureola]|nr:MAG: hypothetical protein LQ349_004910 [Xanthoria aureola]
MPFFYNYTGPYPGTLRLNRANQPPATPQQPVNPWFAPPPQPATAPAPATAPPASNCFYYYPRYDPQPAPAAQPQSAQAPVNPWLVPEPLQPAPTYQAPAPVYYSGHPIPEPAKIWYGSTKAEVDAQNAALAQAAGAYTPMNLVPANPGAGQQFWCKELNDCYTLRTMTDIEASCQPGSWHTSSVGYPYFVRKPPAT